MREVEGMLVTQESVWMVTEEGDCSARLLKAQRAHTYSSRAGGKVFSLLLKANFFFFFTLKNLKFYIYKCRIHH